MGHDELAYVRKLRGQGKLQEVEDFLLKGEPSAAVLDELRKTYSAKAKAAKKVGDWAAVVPGTSRPIWIMLKKCETTALVW